MQASRGRIVRNVKKGSFLNLAVAIGTNRLLAKIHLACMNIKTLTGASMSRRLIAELENPDAASPIKTIKLYENEGHTHELYIDGMHGALIAGHTIKLNCFSRLLNSTSDQETEERIVVGRLVMGIDTFFSTVEWLNSIASQLKTTISSE